MRFDVPLIPEPGYTAFLSSLRDRLHAVYVSFPTGPVLDSRFRFGRFDEADLSAALNALDRPRTYALINSRFYRPEAYRGGGAVEDAVSRLKALKRAACLDGVVFTDVYFLQALLDADPRFMADLEAVPGLNCHLDGYGKIRSMLEHLRAMGAGPPRKLVLDRRLNRRPKDLESVVRKVRKAYPGLRIGLIANEGCLPDCPYKPAHDAHIALGNTGLAAECTHALNRDLGCLRFYGSHPEAVFRSPLIRPEDVHRYEGLVDFVKLSGRTLGAGFLQRTIRAYIESRFDGNLLALSDTLSALADRLAVSNADLPPDFWERSCRCHLHCDGCSFCQAMVRDHLKVLPPTLKPLAG